VQPVVSKRKQPGRPKNGNSEETRFRILEVAVEAFAESGFHGVATRTIAQRAGVSPSTVYHHFSDKQGLYVKTYRHALNHVYAEYARVIDGHASVIDELRVILQCSLAIMRARPAISTLIVRAHIDVTDPVLHPMVGTRTARNFLDGMISRAQDRGELDPADAVSLERTIGVFLWGLSVLGCDDDRARQECVDALDLLLAGQLLPLPQYRARAPRRRARG
jgi:AcrR family transcriptional regulator